MTGPYPPNFPPRNLITHRWDPFGPQPMYGDVPGPFSFALSTAGAPMLAVTGQLGSAAAFGVLTWNGSAWKRAPTNPQQGSNNGWSNALSRSGHVAVGGAKRPGPGYAVSVGTPSPQKITNIFGFYDVPNGIDVADVLSVGNDLYVLYAELTAAAGKQSFKVVKILGTPAPAALSAPVTLTGSLGAQPRLVADASGGLYRILNVTASSVGPNPGYNIEIDKWTGSAWSGLPSFLISASPAYQYLGFDAAVSPQGNLTISFCQGSSSQFNCYVYQLISGAWTLMASSPAIYGNGLCRCAFDSAGNLMFVYAAVSTAALTINVASGPNAGTYSVPAAGGISGLAIACAATDDPIIAWKDTTTYGGSEFPIEAYFVMQMTKLRKPVAFTTPWKP